MPERVTPWIDCDRLVLPQLWALIGDEVEVYGVIDLLRGIPLQEQGLSVLAGQVGEERVAGSHHVRHGLQGWVGRLTLILPGEGL